MDIVNYTPTLHIEKRMEIMCSNRNSTASTSLRVSQNEALQECLRISLDDTLENTCKTPLALNVTNNAPINETKQSITTLQKLRNQDLALTNNNDESLLIEQRARITLNRFKEMMSKFKTLNVDTQPSPVMPASESELKANLSHIKCPNDVVCLVNHLLYSPIGIHRTHPAQEMKQREQSVLDVNDNDSPLRNYVTKEFGQPEFFLRCEKQEILTQKNEMTKAIQQSMPPGNISKESTINRGKDSKERILKYENKLSLDSLTHSQKLGNDSNNKSMVSRASYKSVSMIDLSNHKKQRNLEQNNEPPTENLDGISEFRKRKRTVVARPLSPHLSSTNDSNKIQAKSGISSAAKKMKIQPSNLRAPTSISRFKYGANQRKVGFTNVSLNSSNMDGFKTSTNSQLRLSHKNSNIKQRK